MAFPVLAQLVQMEFQAVVRLAQPAEPVQLAASPAELELRAPQVFQVFEVLLEG